MYPVKRMSGQRRELQRLKELALQGIMQNGQKRANQSRDV
jgi:hypothetical protein